MKFGYSAGWRGNIFSEIEFAKKHFDFTEITIQPELLKTIDEIFTDIKNAIGDFEVLGHVHWDVIETDDIIKNIEVLKNLGAKKITVHPFQNLTIEENAVIFNKISHFSEDNDLILLIENVSGAPYNKAEAMAQLAALVPGAKITLDIGHANRNLELENFMESLKSKVGHIHLHDNIGTMDHVFFTDKTRLNKMIDAIKSIGYDDTVLMETFSVMKNGANESQESLEDIKKLHIEQLKLIK